MIAIMTTEDFYLASPYLPSETVLGQPLISTDGRFAVCHPFVEDDVAYLVEHGADMCEVLPSDFILPIEVI